MTCLHTEYIQVYDTANPLLNIHDSCFDYTVIKDSILVRELHTCYDESSQLRPEPAQ